MTVKISSAQHLERARARALTLWARRYALDAVDDVEGPDAIDRAIEAEEGRQARLIAARFGQESAEAAPALDFSTLEGLLSSIASCTSRATLNPLARGGALADAMAPILGTLEGAGLGAMVDATVERVRDAVVSRLWDIGESSLVWEHRADAWDRVWHDAVRLHVAALEECGYAVYQALRGRQLERDQLACLKTAMGRLRASLAAYGAGQTDPRRLLGMLDDMVEHHHGELPPRLASRPRRVSRPAPTRASNRWRHAVRTHKSGLLIGFRPDCAAVRGCESAWVMPDCDMPDELRAALDAIPAGGRLDIREWDIQPTLISGDPIALRAADRATVSSIIVEDQLDKLPEVLTVRPTC